LRQAISKKQSVDNSIGATPEMPRNLVDDNPRNDCSDGYHVGTIDYVNGFNKDQGHVIIVKVNPRDAVSVPNYDTTKLRVCKYEVIEEYTGDLDKSPVYSEKTTPVSPFVDEDDDDEEVYDRECESCGRYVDDSEGDICDYCMEAEENDFDEDNFDDEDDFDENGEPVF